MYEKISVNFKHCGNSGICHDSCICSTSSRRWTRLRTRKTSPQPNSSWKQASQTSTSYSQPLSQQRLHLRRRTFCQTWLLEESLRLQLSTRSTQPLPPLPILQEHWICKYWYTYKILVMKDQVLSTWSFFKFYFSTFVNLSASI